MSKKDEMFSKLVGQQPPEVKDWILDMDKFLTDGGCKSSMDAKNTFTYTSKKSKKMVCKISIDPSGCTIRPNTNCGDLAIDFPEIMLAEMRGGRGCGTCAEKNPDFVQCRHGGPFELAYNGEKFQRCRYYGFNFSADNAIVREVLKKWIELELEGC